MHLPPRQLLVHREVPWIVRSSEEAWGRLPADLGVQLGRGLDRPGHRAVVPPGTPSRRARRSPAAPPTGTPPPACRRPAPPSPPASWSPAPGSARAGRRRAQQPPLAGEADGPEEPPPAPPRARPAPRSTARAPVREHLPSQQHRPAGVAGRRRAPRAKFFSGQMRPRTRAKSRLRARRLRNAATGTPFRSLAAVAPLAGRPGAATARRSAAGVRSIQPEHLGGVPATAAGAGSPAPAGRRGLRAQAGGTRGSRSHGSGPSRSGSAKGRVGFRGGAADQPSGGRRR